MGRKIPAKKHRGVKDPLIQQAKRMQELKGKINAPPKDPDDQPVPKSLSQLFAFESRIKGNSIDVKRKKKKNTKDRDNVKREKENPMSKLRKLPGESGRSFSMRINSAVRALHAPADPQHYPFEMETEDIKGEQMALQRARRKRKRDKAAPAPASAPAPTRAQTLALKKKAKREKALEKQKRGGGGGGGEGEVRRERVAFGEVAHAPPALLARPRRAPRAERQPGRKELLLSGLLRGDAGAAEAARLAAVAAYRALRARAAPPL